MSHCKLYIVEGLPFSGKSTTSRHAAEAPRRRGHPVACWDEGSGDHPADYEFHAFLTESQLAALDADGLRLIAEPVPGGFILPLAQLELEVQQRLFPFKIYDGLPWAVERPLNPTVVYLETQDVAARMAEAARERDPEWLHAVIDYHTGQGYGLAHGLVGFDGYAACLEARQRRELDMLNALDIRKLTLTDPFRSWDAALAALYERL